MRRQYSETRCYELLRQARWPDGISCPLCGMKRITVHSKFDGLARRRYLCLNCQRTFSDLKGTPFARTNLPLSTWFLCLRLVGQGRNTVELARDLEVKWDTAVHMQRQIAKGLSSPGLIRRLREAVENDQRG